MLEQAQTIRIVQVREFVFPPPFNVAFLFVSYKSEERPVYHCDFVINKCVHFYCPIK